MDERERKVRVWDLPTRLFHWVLVAAVIGLVITAKVGGNAIEWHFRLGWLVFALIAFRLAWGLVGGHWSRFTTFVRGPGTVVRYLRGQSDAREFVDVGHNPLGALSVLGLLTILGLQVATGLFADDEIANTGPLVSLVSGTTSSALTSWHKTFGQWLIFLLVGLHVAAILFYLLKKKLNLIAPMVHGDKHLPADTPASADGWRTRLLALVLFVASTALVSWVWKLGASASGG
jgi:cytochrome b